ncbi:MAG: hypothetical protein Q8R72_15895 [Hylemonella sp.]|nr:hypothetical protein [Hylemonella sp.]
MYNETTMPALLTMPGTLQEDARRNAARFLIYKLIFAAAVLALGLGLWLF